MSNQKNVVTMTTNQYEQALIQGDLAGLSPDQRLNYYKSVCESVGLNPLTKPFEYIQLNGKLTLYAKRDATDQLRKLNKVSIKITEVKTMNDVYIVIAEAKDKDGREDSSTGAVNIKGLFGDSLANAFMKAETKAKRRVTLSVCGLGLLDESEIESIKDAKPFSEPPAQPQAAQITVKTQESAKQQESVSAPTPDDSTHGSPGDYVVTFGQFKTKALKEIEPDKISSYIAWLESGAEKTNKPLTNGPLAFVTEGKKFLAELAEMVPQDQFEERMEF